MWKAELHVFYVQSALYPLRLVVGLYAQYALRLLVDALGMVEVDGFEQQGQPVVIDHDGRIGEEEVAVGLQVDDATVGEEASIAFEEEGAGEAFVYVLHLRVAESEPYLLHFAWSEEAVDNFDVGTQKRYITQVFLYGLFGSGVHACAFYVNPYEVDVGEELGQSHRIFAFAAAEFEYDGVVVVEIAASPTALHGEGLFGHCRIWELEDVGKRLHLSEFL